MARKKTTGKKSSRSKANKETSVAPAPQQIQELIVPLQPVSKPVESTPVPTQPVTQPIQAEASSTDRPSQQEKPIETLASDQTAIKQTS